MPCVNFWEKFWKDGQWKCPQSRVIYSWMLKCCCFSPVGDIWWEIPFPLLLCKDCPFLGEGCCGCWLMTAWSSRRVVLDAPWQISLLHFPAQLWYLLLNHVWWFGIVLESSPPLLLRTKSCLFGGGSSRATRIPWPAYRYQEHLIKQCW